MHIEERRFASRYYTYTKCSVLQAVSSSGRRSFTINYYCMADTAPRMQMNNYCPDIDHCLRQLTAILQPYDSRSAVPNTAYRCRYTDAVNNASY